MRVEHRAGRAGQPGVTATEVLVLMDGQRLALDQAGADAIGALARLAPVSAQPQPRTLEAAPLGGGTDAIEDHPTSVGQQHRVACAGKLLVQAVHFMVGNLQHLMQALAAFQQAPMLKHHRRFDHRRVEVVILQAAQPGTGDGRITAALPGPAMGNAMDLPGMAREVIALHCCNSPQIERQPSILHPGRLCNAHACDVSQTAQNVTPGVPAPVQRPLISPVKMTQVIDLPGVANTGPTLALCFPTP
ncbi:hypothetical protein D3C80_1370000 [compost metagenome]